MKDILTFFRNRLFEQRNPKYNKRKLLAFSIPGWFSRVECRYLFELTILTRGPILEIGHFLGRSTACIAEALKQSSDLRKFVSYDLGFISKQEFTKFFNNVHNHNVPVPKLARQIYNQNTTSTELAKKNLANLGLMDYVELISGNFIEIDSGKYDFIFCDAMHEDNEIRLNLPQIINRSEENCIWAFHDMSDLNIDIILDYSKALYINRVNRLGIFQYSNKQ